MFGPKKRVKKIISVRNDKKTIHIKGYREKTSSEENVTYILFVDTSGELQTATLRGHWTPEEIEEWNNV